MFFYYHVFQYKHSTTITTRYLLPSCIPAVSQHLPFHCPVKFPLILQQLNLHLYFLSLLLRFFKSKSNCSVHLLSFHYKSFILLSFLYHFSFSFLHLWTELNGSSIFKTSQKSKMDCHFEFCDEISFFFSFSFSGGTRSVRTVFITLPFTIKTIHQ